MAVAAHPLPIDGRNTSDLSMKLPGFRGTNESVYRPRVAAATALSTKRFAFIKRRGRVAVDKCLRWHQHMLKDVSARLGADASVLWAR